MVWLFGWQSFTYLVVVKMSDNKNFSLKTIDYTKKPEKTLIINGRILDPANGKDSSENIVLENGVIQGFTSEKSLADCRIIDAAGKWVIPGLIDMHVHLREPGREDKETIATGTRAAAAGGFTSIACMPNTNPALDEESKIRYVLQRAEGCPSKVFPIGAITKGLAGEELAPMGEMVHAGAVAVSDDGKSIDRSNLMRNAFNYSKSFGIPVICHCEDSGLSQKGHMNEGVFSTRLGIRGIPTIAEEIIVSRDLLLAEYTQARVHIAHVSTAGSARLIREAKKRGIDVTAETCPHYISLTDESIGTIYDTNKKMNPPLRTAADRDAIIEALIDGTIDVIASDHAPHVPDEKDVEFDAAAFGVIGLETSVGAIITYLVETNKITPLQMINMMSTLPARILGLETGCLTKGKPADIVIIDPKKKWTVDPHTFYSKARNSCFAGMTFIGQTMMTFLNGYLVFERNDS